MDVSDVIRTLRMPSLDIRKGLGHGSEAIPAPVLSRSRGRQVIGVIAEYSIAASPLAIVFLPGCDQTSAPKQLQAFLPDIHGLGLPVLTPLRLETSSHPPPLQNGPPQSSILRILFLHLLRRVPSEIPPQTTQLLDRLSLCRLLHECVASDGVEAVNHTVRARSGVPIC